MELDRILEQWEKSFMPWFKCPDKRCIPNLFGFIFMNFEIALYTGTLAAIVI